MAGPMKQRCTGHSSQTGDPCKLWPVKGSTVCHKHGGSAKQVRAKALMRVVESEARILMETYGLPVEISAEQGILEEVHRTAGHVAWLGNVVRNLDPEALIWGTTQIKTGGHDGGHTEAAEPNVWLKLYREERAHLAKVCADAIRCGIEERRVKLAEAQGGLLADLIRGILADLDLTAAQQALVPEVVPRHLRAVTA